MFANMVLCILVATAGLGLLKKKSTALFCSTYYSLFWLIGVFQRYIRYEYNTFQMAVSVLSTILTAAHMNKRHREFKGGW